MDILMKEKALLSLFISDNVDLRTRNIIRGKEGHFIMQKEQCNRKTKQS